MTLQNKKPRLAKLIYLGTSLPAWGKDFIIENTEKLCYSEPRGTFLAIEDLRDTDM